MQDFVGSVLDAAGSIPTDANKALTIFDDLVVILNVDVNVTGMNNDAEVRFVMSNLHFHLTVRLSMWPAL